VYVKDVARANVLALEGEVPPGANNVGSGSETSVNELYMLLLRISGKDLAPEHGPAKPVSSFEARWILPSPGASWVGTPRWALPPVSRRPSAFLALSETKRSVWM
jgi:nucleoside-diphosphate-sugar epimerase